MNIGYIGFIVLPSDTAIVPAAVIVSVLFALNDVLFLYIDSGAYITAPDLPVPVNYSNDIIRFRCCIYKNTK